MYALGWCPSMPRSIMCGAIPPLPNTPSKHGACLKKAQVYIYHGEGNQVK